MIHWEPCGGWMAFPYLTKGYGVLTRSFTLGYRITDNPSDPWTQRFNRFKDKDMSALFGGADLLRGAVPELVKTLKMDMEDSIFVTALSSGETTASDKRALPIITRKCAEIVGAAFSLDALTKDVHGKIHDFRTESRRDEELEKANYKSTKLGKRNIFVFDDFITRGATQTKIGEAILSQNPKSKVYAVALCKTENQAYCPNPDNAHIHERWNTLWEKGEQRYRDRK